MYGLEYQQLEALMLGFLRCISALAIMPVFGYTTVPVQVKGGLALLLAVVIAPAAMQHTVAGPPGVMPLVAAAISEVMVGIIFGLVTILVMMGAQLAGSVLGIQMGLGIARVIDPQSGGQTSLVARLEYSMALIIFVILDVHLRFLEALGTSFIYIPLGSAVFPGDIAMNYGRLTGLIFIIGVKLAAPVMAMLLLIQTALGFMARVMPRMNVFLIGFPLKIGVGLLGIAITMPLFVSIIDKSFDLFMDGLNGMLEMMAGL
ncbi:MAG: flagellar biosynthetic protein FliR [Calditrichaeota bacterium]|nr:flagellar biosynthetic protein FliR [Calditrichota bacterium]